MTLWPLRKKKSKVDTEYIIGSDPKTDLEHLIEACKNNLITVDEELIKKAFNWCYETHKNKVRKTGEAFYTHPLQVAYIIISEMPLDDISVACALLHNVVDEGDTFGMKDIQSEFGTTIAEIVEQITKIRYIEGHKIEHLENYRKLLLSLFKDVRIILIKLADRLHNMRTLDWVSPTKQVQMSEETMEIYAPFAERFGLANIKWELEDLSFKYTNPEAYNQINTALQSTREEREEYIDTFSAPIMERLNKDEFLRKKNIKFEITGRPKHIFSIYHKMIARGLPMEQLFDLFAVRIIIDTDDSSYCFIVYGIISDIYTPVPGTFKDYISMPKKNSYQSIHTAVIDEQHNKSVEIQIRTRKMHEIAERGVAAHFNYKRGFLPAQSVLDDKNIEEWMGLVRNIFENPSEETPEQLIDSVRQNLFADEIIVFTPKNEFRIFPKEATPLDFAFAIHSDIGIHCIGAKVNGKIVPLDYKLESGDTIEIITSKNQKPSKEWLKYVITQRAKNLIMKYLKAEGRRAGEEGLQIWKALLEKVNHKFTEAEFNDLLKTLKFEHYKDFYNALGTAQLDVSLIYEYVNEKIKGIDFGTNNKNGKLSKYNLDSVGKTLKAPGVKIIYAKCCNPLPGDEIVCTIKAGQEMTIHRHNCPEIKSQVNSHQPTIFELDWSVLTAKDFTIKIKVTGDEKPAMLNKTTSKVLAMKDVNLRGFNFD
ncbi:MAG: RelA/SpoT family protein, partial [FCB group bacterium]